MPEILNKKASKDTDTTPLVSIIVPVYNVEKYLERCLDSLLNQDCDFVYEIIGVDDCSPDGSADILRRYKLLFPNKIVVAKNDNNSGLGLTRNHGLNLARGKYIMFVDSDDFVKKDYLQRYVSEMGSDNFDVVVGGYILTSENSDNKIEKTNIIPVSPWSEICFSTACMKLYKKEFLLANNLRFTDIRFAEDKCFSLYAFASGMRQKIIPYAGYYYYFNPSSITHGKRADNEYEIILTDFYKEFLGSMEYKNLSEDKKRMIEYSYIADMLNTILLYSRGCGKKRMIEKYTYFMQELKYMFPDYKSSPYLTAFGPKGQRPKTRIGVGGFMLLDKLHLTKPFFLLFGIL